MTGRGGKRENAGRKTGPTGTAAQRFTEARARKEQALADLREMEAGEKARQLIPVAEVAECFATGNARVAQMLLNLPDELERAVGLSPEAAELVERRIHAAMNDLADDLANLTAPGDSAV